MYAITILLALVALISLILNVYLLTLTNELTDSLPKLKF